MMETWVLFIMLAGVQTQGDPVFTTRSACEIYKHIRYDKPPEGPTLTSMFKIECVKI